MHYLTRLVIEADDTDEALSEAMSVMDRLVEDHEYDWYNDTADDSRWDECWKPVPLNSEKGLAWVNDAMTGQFEDFKHSMRAIRTMIANYTDEQIFEDDYGEKPDAFLSRWHFSNAAGYRSSSSQLWDSGGSSISNRKDLNYYLKDSDRLWVVQVDAHN